MKAFLIFLTGLMLMTGGITRTQAAEDNLHFSGNLISDPCELDPNTTDLQVNFQSVIEKSLYANTRTAGIPFTINLTGCDTALGNAMTLTFKGSEDLAMPGLLAVTGTAAGIAIGIESTVGVLLPLNQPTAALTLADGSNSFTFKAYVTGETEAIAKQTITPGDFSATATFEIAYP